MKYRYNVPSVKTILQTGCTDYDAAIIRGVIKDDINPLDYPCVFPDTVKWVNSCWHEPSKMERKLSAIDETLPRSYGVEAIFPPEGKNGNAVHYCNRGDTYDTTILFYQGRYRVGDWGTIVERLGW